jgi:hypothetical protein
VTVGNAPEKDVPDHAFSSLVVAPAPGWILADERVMIGQKVTSCQES